MKLEGVIHCEAAECDHHQHVGGESMARHRLPPGWVVLREFGDAGALHEFAFCNLDCALKWLAANSRPPEVIDAGELLGGDA